MMKQDGLISFLFSDVILSSYEVGIQTNSLYKNVITLLNVSFILSKSSLSDYDIGRK